MSLCTRPAWSFDSFSATHTETLFEHEHSVVLTLHRDHGELVVRRSVYNAGLGRYINFVSGFLAAENGATRERAAVARAELKKLDTPKDYASWVKARPRRRGE